MSKTQFTMGELAQAIAGGNESAMRKMLNDAGGRYDELGSDSGELVPRQVVIDLAAIRAGDVVGRRAAALLG